MEKHHKCDPSWETIEPKMHKVMKISTSFVSFCRNHYHNQSSTMSSLTVMCPNGHRVKVSTNPSMSLQAVLDLAANKKGFDPATHVLEFHKIRIDLSASVRFSGILRICLEEK